MFQLIQYKPLLVLLGLAGFVESVASEVQVQGFHAQRDAVFVSPAPLEFLNNCVTVEGEFIEFLTQHALRVVDMPGLSGMRGTFRPAYVRSPDRRAQMQHGCRYVFDVLKVCIERLIQFECVVLIYLADAIERCITMFRVAR